MRILFCRIDSIMQFLLYKSYCADFVIPISSYLIDSILFYGFYYEDPIIYNVFYRTYYANFIIQTLLYGYYHADSII